MQAKDIMTTNVITVSPDTLISGVAGTLTKNRISAVPVVDANGDVRGIVSEGDLMRRPETGTEPHHSWWLRLIEMPEEHSAEYVKTHGLTAADVMTSPAVTVTGETPVSEIAELFERKGIKRVPVMAEGHISGIVSRANLVRALAGYRSVEPSRKPADDASLREKVEDVIRNDAEIAGPFINVIVNNGIVDLWGAVETANEKKAIRIAAESVAGKESVNDHIGILSPEVRGLIWAE